MATIKSNHKIVILGAGHFGQRALKKLSEFYPKNPIIIVDKNMSALQSHLSSFNKNIHMTCDDGVNFILSHTNQLLEQSDWIVPSIPIHLAYEWMITHFTKINNHHLTLSTKLIHELPNPVAGKMGTIYMSYATFRCPDNCPEPSDYCYYTNKPRNNSLYNLLNELDISPYTSVVIRSHQLMPGVGGYQFSDLQQARSLIQKNNSPVLLSTACRCHGVMNGFSWER